jgi:hypothetical protein
MIVVPPSNSPTVPAGTGLGRVSTWPQFGLLIVGIAVAAATDRSATAAIDCRIHDDEHDGELGYLGSGYLQHRSRVADQQPTDLVGAEGGVEVGSDARAGAAGGGRVIGTGVGRTDVDPENVDRRAQLIERRRRTKCVDERGTRVVEIILLGIGEAFSQEDDIKRPVAGCATEDLGGSYHGAVCGTRGWPPPPVFDCSGNRASSTT